MKSSTAQAHDQCAVLTVLNQYGEFTRVSAWLTTATDRFHLPENVHFKLDLVLNEVLPNIFDYAFADDSSHEIAIALINTPESVQLEVTDDGIPFNPFVISTVKAATSLADASIGGRGIMLIKSFTDNQAYERRSDKNVIRLSINKSINSNA